MKYGWTQHHRPKKKRMTQTEANIILRAKLRIVKGKLQELIREIQD